MKGDLASWDRVGRPGSDRTVCGSVCFCMLTPAEVITDHPGLRNGLNQPKKGVLTSARQKAVLNDHR